jgi:hypothetical protein
MVMNEYDSYEVIERDGGGWRGIDETKGLVSSGRRLL